MMAASKQGQGQGSDRQEAARLLRDRHEREAELLAELMASVSRRAAAQVAVEAETEQIKSRLADMARLGFDEATLVGLGIDVGGIGAARPSRRREPPAENGKPVTGDAAAPMSATETPAGESGPTEAAVAVRTTSHLSGSARNGTAPSS